MHFLITAGGTREYIDPVRFISNASSGKMGYALVRAALRAGHKVTLITAQATQREPAGAKVIKVESAAEMFEAVKKHFAKCNCLIMAAAVADYTPARAAKRKLKKTADSLTLKLKPTADILKWAGSHKKVRGQKTEDRRQKGQIIVGFALEDKALKKRAEKKMKEKNLDVLMKICGGRWVELAATRKTVIARRVIREADSLYGWS